MPGICPPLQPLTCFLKNHAMTHLPSSRNVFHLYLNKCKLFSTANHEVLPQTARLVIITPVQRPLLGIVITLALERWAGFSGLDRTASCSQCVQTLLWVGYLFGARLGLPSLAQKKGFSTLATLKKVIMAVCCFRPAMNVRVRLILYLLWCMRFLILIFKKFFFSWKFNLIFSFALGLCKIFCNLIFKHFNYLFFKWHIVFTISVSAMYTYLWFI